MATRFVLKLKSKGLYVSNRRYSYGSGTYRRHVNFSEARIYNNRSAARFSLNSLNYPDNYEVVAIVIEEPS